MDMCLYVWMPVGTRRGIRSPVGGVTGSYELTDVGAVNQTQVHRKSSSPLTEPSVSPAPILFSVVCQCACRAHIQIWGQLFFKDLFIFLLFIFTYVSVWVFVHMGVHRVKKRMSDRLELGFPGVFELSNVLSIAGLEDREACSPNHWAIALAWWKTSGRQLSPSSMYSRVWSQMLRLAWRVLLSMEHPPELCWLGMM